MTGSAVWRLGAALAGAALLLPACATSNAAYQGIDSSVQRDDFEAALHALKTGHKRIYPKKNAVLFYLDRGMLNHYAQKFEESSADLQEAEALIEKNFSKSITQSAASYIVNDNAKDYAGEDYENVYLNVFNALNYYHRGNIEDALVEIRRVNEKLEYLEEKYAKAIAKAKAANNAGGKVKTDATVRFNNSALARYLATLLWRADNKMDDARLDFAAIAEAFKSAPNVYPFPCAAAFTAKGGSELNIPAGKARINIIAFAGLAPYKEEESILLPLPLPPPNHFARMSLPHLVNRPSGVSRVTARLENGNEFALDLIEDMGLAAAETFKAGYALTVLKTSIRSIIKQTTGAGLAQAASDQGGSALGLLVGLITTVASTASEQADIRVSRYLPRYAYAGGINVEPGDYSLTVTFAGGASRTLTLKAEADKLNLVEVFYLK